MVSKYFPLRVFGDVLLIIAGHTSSRLCSSYCVGLRLCSLGTSASIWPIVPSLDDGWWWTWSNQWNGWKGKTKYSEKTCRSAALSTTNPTWPELGSNPGHRGWKPATYRLSWQFMYMLCECFFSPYPNNLIVVIVFLIRSICLWR
jgi:hypothetical protein